LGHANLRRENKTKSETRKMSEEQQQKQIDISNLDEIEEEIETSSLYFKPKPGQEYFLRFNPEVNPIDVRETPFKTPEGQPVKRYYHKGAVKYSKRINSKSAFISKLYPDAIRPSSIK
jgi:hypothetical protein